MPGVPPTRFVYLGPEGTFSEQALRTVPAADRGVLTPARSVPEALDALRAGDADAALVPLENSIGGQVGVTLDELANGEPLIITREVVLPVQFVLAAAEDRSLDSVRTVAAHPQAGAQCRKWLRDHVPQATVVDVLSNATAAIDAGAGEFDAAVCAPIGASRYKLHVLAKDIADNPDAMTRFALVSRPGPPPPPTGERLGRYVFFLDCGGHVADAPMGEALQGLRRICADVRFLGSYPRAKHSEPAPRRAPGMADEDFTAAARWLEHLRTGG